jgi:flagellar biosynthesis protein FlhB
VANEGGERTEKPTAKKIKEARDKGQVARSRDLAGALSFAGAVMAIGALGVSMFGAISGRLISGLSSLGDRPRAGIDAAGIAGIMWADAGLLAAVVGPPMAVAAFVSILASVSQTGFVFSSKALELNWSRLSPAQGLARFKPAQAGTEVAKSLVGMVVVGVVCYLVLRHVTTEAPTYVAMTPAAASASGWGRMMSFLGQGSLALVTLAGADYGIQRWRWYSQLKMTRQEIRDEGRMQEGSPELKARVRKAQRDMTRRRMLQDVKGATVVITNPTHFAVAITYHRAEMAAPKVVAKGQDLMAARIRAVAEKHGIPIVENVSLARTLYKTAEVGDTIPADLFGAVAEVLAYLVRLKQLVL